MIDLILNEALDYRLMVLLLSMIGNILTIILVLQSVQGAGSLCATAFCQLFSPQLVHNARSKTHKKKQNKG